MGELATVGQGQIEVRNGQDRTLGGAGRDARLLLFVRARLREGLVEGGETLDRGAEAGETGVALTKKFIAVLTSLKASAAWLNVPKSTFFTKNRKARPLHRE